MTRPSEHLIFCTCLVHLPPSHSITLGVVGDGVIQGDEVLLTELLESLGSEHAPIVQEHTLVEVHRCLPQIGPVPLPPFVCIWVLGGKL